MKVAIIGYGIEGQSALRYWLGRGAHVTICDQSEGIAVPDGVHTQLGDGYLQHLNRFDVINRTASIHPDVILAANTGVANKITTVINEFFRASPTHNIIGITGTKGKGTTSSLIANILQVAGKEVFLGGNIGISPLDFLPQITPDSWVVLELSSYQLYDLRHSPHIAACLMVVPEHLNWHADMDDYIRSKSNLFAHQTPKDIAIYYADSEVSHQIASVSRGGKIPYYASPGAYIEDEQVVIDDQVLCSVDELQLLGTHNWQNVCAAVTVAWQITKDTAAIRSVLTSFMGLPHRLEPVREVDGVMYYNDSFAATPHAAEAALEAIPGKKVLIIGGYDRMLPLEHLAKALKENERDIRRVILIGQSGPRLLDELEAVGFHHAELCPATTMDDIVRQAKDAAHTGDSIVLTPGFASFDMFKNFEERGMQFKKEINAL